MSRLALALLFALVFAGILQAHDRTAAHARAQAAVSLAYAAITAPVLEVLEVQAETETPSQPAKPTPSTSPEPTPAREPATYKDAYRLYRMHERPIVVMVTAKWCVYCPPVKAELERMRRDGKLDHCSLVYVDYDAEPETAKSIFGRIKPSLPHVAVYYHQDGRTRTARPADVKQVPGILAGSDHVREMRSVLK